MKKYVVSFIIIILMPLSLKAQQSLCFSSDDFLVKTYYESSSSSPYGKNHMLFISYKNSDNRQSLTGNIIYNNGKFAGIKYSNDNISCTVTSLDPSFIILSDNKSVPLKPAECFMFLTSYDTTIDSTGDTINILTAGKLFRQEKINGKYKPSFDCSEASLGIEKAVCNNNEISFLDNMFVSSMECYKKKAVDVYKDKDAAFDIGSIGNDFLVYRNSFYKSSNNLFTAKEQENIKKAYMLGIIFLPMTIAAENGNILALGRNLFMSYYILSKEGITYSGSYKTGLSQSKIVKSVLGDMYDEIMFYLSGIYDNLNSRLANLFYYTVYLQEKNGIINKDGSYICK